jgi:hypothetical protein
VIVQGPSAPLVGTESGTSSGKVRTIKAVCWSRSAILDPTRKTGFASAARMWKLLLELSTLLGGIAAGWLLWEKLVPFMRSRAVKVPRVRRSPSPLPPERRGVAWYCTAASLFLALFVKNPELMMGIGVLLVFVSGAVWKLAEKRSEVIELTFLYGSVFAFVWGWLTTVLLLVLDEWFHMHPNAWLSAAVLAGSGSFAGRRWAHWVTDYS